MAAVTSLPELTAKKRVLDAHTNMASALLGAIKARGVDVLYRLEQNAAAGTAPLADLRALLQARPPAPQHPSSPAVLNAVANAVGHAVASSVPNAVATALPNAVANAVVNAMAISVAITVGLRHDTAPTQGALVLVHSTTAVSWLCGG